MDSVQEMGRNNSALSREGARVWEPVSISATSGGKSRTSDKGREPDTTLLSSSEDQSIVTKFK